MVNRIPSFFMTVRKVIKMFTGFDIKGKYKYNLRFPNGNVIFSVIGDKLDYIAPYTTILLKGKIVCRLGSRDVLGSRAISLWRTKSNDTFNFNESIVDNFL